MTADAFDAIVLAGGLARRLDGADKAMLPVAGMPMLRHVLDAVAAAERRIVVGPQRALGADVIWCRETPPGGGPVAGIAAGVPHTRAATVVVLAGDLPRIAPAVDLLRAKLTASGRDLAMLASGGYVNFLAAAWRRSALLAALVRIGEPRGSSMRGLVEPVAPAIVQDGGEWGRDCDTWADLAEVAELAGPADPPRVRTAER